MRATRLPRLVSTRLAPIGLALLAALAAGPALAQITDTRNSPSEINQRLSTQSQIRDIENRQQFDNNQTRMQIQRNELFRPAPSTGIIGPRR